MIGEKTLRVRIEQRVESADGQGGAAVTWALRGVVSAKERPVNGRAHETRLAAQMTSVVPTVLEIWHRRDVRVTDRLRIGSRTLEIHGTYDPDGRARELYLICGEVQGAAVATNSQEPWIDSQLA